MTDCWESAIICADLTATAIYPKGSRGTTGLHHSYVAPESQAGLISSNANSPAEGVLKENRTKTNKSSF